MVRLDQIPPTSPVIPTSAANTSDVKSLTPVEKRVSALGEGKIEEGSKQKATAPSLSAMGRRWEPIRKWFAEGWSNFVSLVYRIFRITPSPTTPQQAIMLTDDIIKKMSEQPELPVSDDVEVSTTSSGDKEYFDALEKFEAEGFIDANTFESLFAFAESVTRQLTTLQEKMKTITLTEENKYVSLSQGREELKEMRQWIDELKEILPDVEDLLDEAEAQYSLATSAIQGKIDVLKQWLPQAREYLEQNGLDDAEKDHMLQFCECADFLSYINQIDPIDQAFAEEVKRGLFGTLSKSSTETVEELDVDVEAKFNDPKFCSPEVLEVIERDPQLKRLITEDLTTSLKVPQEGFTPVGLQNTGNSCYRNSTNQMILHSPISRLLEQPRCERGSFLILKEGEGLDDKIVDIKNRLQVYKAFKELAATYIDFENCRKNGESTLQAQKAMYASEKKYTNTLIASGLMYDLHENSRNQQQDAAAYAEALYGVLGVSFPLQEKYETLPNASIQIKSEKQTHYPMVQLPLITELSLEDVIDDNFSPQFNDDPKEAWEGNTNYSKLEKIAGEPQETLTIHIKRRVWNQFTNYRYLKDPIDIPSDEIDMSAAYEQAPGSAIYEITGFVAYTPFNLSGDSGHYFSYVKKEDGWYRCNDSSITHVSDEEVADARQDAYLLTLKIKAEGRIT